MLSAFKDLKFCVGMRSGAAFFSSLRDMLLYKHRNGLRYHRFHSGAETLLAILSRRGGILP